MFDKVVISYQAAQLELFSLQYRLALVFRGTRIDLGLRPPLSLPPSHGARVKKAYNVRFSFFCFSFSLMHEAEPQWVFFRCDKPLEAECRGRTTYALARG